ncbi:amidohydrolase family protein [Actinocrispum sp. NPDC049592]|uniref:amidohydrolase family protein n=1 Tax=Actinocrispum sp. NPDC049592 TaxID=3154835 RepID=UPI0034352702
MLIKNGYLPGVGVRDIAIEDGVIAESTSDGQTLDATGLVVIPGFVDTHRHLVQAPLRGIGPDMNLEHYLTNVLSRMRFTEEEAHNAILLGAAEALNAGITTIIDWSTAAIPSQVSLAALEASGIRAVFAHNNVDDEADIRKHAGRQGLVTTALAPLGLDYLSIEDTERHLALARELGLLTSMHIGGRRPGGIEAMRHLLGPDLHFLHGNRSSDDEIKMIIDSGSALTVTTIVESLMGHGSPAYDRIVKAGGKPALGVDVVVNNRPDMFSEMLATLCHERRIDQTIPARDMLTAATVNGAKALRLDTGEIKPGKRADLVLLDGLQHLLGTPEVEGAIVTTLGPENVHTVLVDGRIVKQDGVLRHHDLAALRAKTNHLAKGVLTPESS